MSRKLKIWDYIWIALAALSVFFLVLAVTTPRSVGDAASAAKKIEQRLGRRMAKLDWYAVHPQAKLPDDMVIYCYSGDSLKSWRNQFPLFNDDIGSRMVVQRITNPRVNLRSPLSYVGEEPSFINIGPKWYIVKSGWDGDNRIISGLQIINTLDNKNYNGVNPRLHLGLRFSVRPLTFSEGSPVRLDGRPVFKVLYDSLSGVIIADASLMWTALLLFMAAVVFFVFSRRTIKRAHIAFAAIIGVSAAMYFWGRGAQAETSLFSPVLYAGGQFLFSLGAVLLMNLAVMLSVLCLYLVRRSIWARADSPVKVWILSIADLLGIVAIMLYTHLTLQSIVANSSISLELYKLGTLSVYSILVYISFLVLLTSVPMLLQMMQPVASRWLGVHYDMFSPVARTVIALLTSAYLVLTTALLGFEKEEDRMEVWAGKLAVDRDITMELQLLKMERSIAEDAVITTLAGVEHSEVIIRNRIVDNYFLSDTQDYSVNVQMVIPGISAASAVAGLEQIAREGVPIADGSAFLSTPTPEGPCSYVGVFPYISRGSLSYLLVEVTRKSTMVGKGYARLLNYSAPGRTSLPAAYSYSRYRGRDLVLFNGTFPYSTRMDDWMNGIVYDTQVCHYVRDGYVHFVNVITAGEAVLISRRRISATNYVVAVVFIALVMFGLLWCLRPKNRRKDDSGPNYFRSRISMTLMLSLILALVVMASVSVVFVFRRNEANRQAIMSGRINSIQLLAQDGMRHLDGTPSLNSSEFASLIQSVSDNTGSDITVYGTDGQIVFCTYPEAIDRLLVGFRMEESVLGEIIKLNKRYFISKESLGWRHYYNMYMPMLGSDGRVMAILCSPYVEESYDFERDAVMHFMSVLTVFLLLFIVARFTESAVLERVFRPLSLMGLTMRRAKGGTLEHISYGRVDEISALVDAYNRMVDELSESTLRLAQAERDKAWSGMARQVAHEIKNPLTPMKLQIQRLIRLKDKGDPSWQEKFDDVSKVLLDHIDILTETSNEFSTFAKLYSEEHTDINLDAMLQQEISMFDNREAVRFSYMGLEGAVVKGPRPQLTRVFVNLLGNAVQAVEGRNGAEVLVSLRKSARENCYDIVVEDNGPGVSEENVGKLFTPNFTTKNGGSGLGLAISRSILESCGATITYSRSFALGGACFTVQYPAL